MRIASAMCSRSAGFSSRSPSSVLFLEQEGDDLSVAAFTHEITSIAAGRLGRLRR